MSQPELYKLYRQLDEIQKKYLFTLKAKIASEKSAFNRQQMRDMLALIELDIKSRSTLASVKEMIPRVEISESSYLSFLEDVAAILHMLTHCSIPPEAAEAYAAIGKLVQSQNRLNVLDIFTCISITITVLSLCLSQLSIQHQQNAIAALDRLLEVKTTQLSLLEQTSRFYKDFSPRNPFF